MSAASALSACPNCHYVGKPKMKGSPSIELLLWLCWLFPGVIYSIWRRGDAGNVCIKCGVKGMVPIDTPKASAIVGTEAHATLLKTHEEEVEQYANERKAVKVFIYLLIAALGAVMLWLSTIPHS